MAAGREHIGGESLGRLSVAWHGKPPHLLRQSKGLATRDHGRGRVDKNIGGEKHDAFRNRNPSLVHHRYDRYPEGNIALGDGPRGGIS